MNKKGPKLKYNYSNNKRVTSALLLAAGSGSRLFPLTQHEPKCLTMVNGISILERMITCLLRHGFKRLVIVTGYLENKIRDFLGNQMGDMKIEYIFNPVYKTTNNIYSLWMAREIMNKPFLLLESDLVFDESLLNKMMYTNRIAIAKRQPWMNGTCVTINNSQQVNAFSTCKKGVFGPVKYKTVNMYSISHSSWLEIIKRLDKHIINGNVNDYYEIVFKEMIEDGSLSFTGVFFDNKLWYEIDTIEDLAEAEKMEISSDFININTVAPSHPDYVVNTMALSRDMSLNVTK